MIKMNKNSYQTGIENGPKYHIGITVGVFDLFHIGHLNLLTACKSMCDHLIVCVCNDKYVRDFKKKEPIYPEQERVAIIKALNCVDEVILVNPKEIEDKLLIWKKHPYDVLFSGSDWKGSDRYIATENQFKKYNIAIEYLPYTEGISSSVIKEKLKDY